MCSTTSIFTCCQSSSKAHTQVSQSTWQSGTCCSLHFALLDLCLQHDIISTLPVLTCHIDPCNDVYFCMRSQLVVTTYPHARFVVSDFSFDVCYAELHSFHLVAYLWCITQIHVTIQQPNLYGRQVSHTSSLALAMKAGSLIFNIDMCAAMQNSRWEFRNQTFNMACDRSIPRAIGFS